MARADNLLVELGHASSRALAQKLIKSGEVEYDAGMGWQAVSKASQKLPDYCKLRVNNQDLARYVSRGGLKLQGALESASISPQGMFALDVGQSTGGFTDCLLQHGIQRVVGIDAGHSQLHPKLAGNPKVICLEGVNARDLPKDELLACAGDTGFQLVVMDLSFISQTKVLASVCEVMPPNSQIVALVKPQFELGKENIAKGGLVKNTDLYPQLEESLRKCYAEHGLTVSHYFESPVTGGDGNREFFIVASKP